LWIKSINSNEISSKVLIEQITAYKNQEYPYNELFNLQDGSILNWWKNIEQRNNHIQKLFLN
ncbi:1051_t:CDS:1, partial [Funneliformis caledonium]